MRKIIVSGHLGANPEIKTTSRGTQYTTFRLANHEYSDGENVTYWFTITVWEPSLQKLCENLKKGSLVYVDGLLTDRVYMSNKTGQYDVGRDIRAVSIDFGLGGKRDDDSQGAQPQTSVKPANEPTPETPAQPVTEATATKPAKTKPAAEPAANSDEDDLPF